MTLVHVFLLFVSLICFTSVTGRCPDGTITSIVDTKLCYKFVPNATDWMDAKIQCTSLKGHLVSISDGFSNLFINEKAQQQFPSTDGFFIGANDILQRGSWVWDGTSESVDYENWAVGEPSTSAGKDCASVALQDGNWRATNCFKKEPYVCSVPEVSSACPPPPTCPACPAQRHVYYCDDRWTIFRGHCYRVGVGFNQTFWDASSACKGWDADLASIHSQDENDFVQEFTQTGMTQPWFAQVWIGLVWDPQKAAWTWTDGTAFDYSNWGEGSPSYDDGKGKPNCIELFADYLNAPVVRPGTWNDLSCAPDHKERIGVCKKAANYL